CVDRETGLRTRTILCVPMTNKDGKIVGVVQLLNKRDGTFTTEDEDAIKALSVHAALAVEKERLYRQEKAKLVLEKELSAAHTVQVQLLPKEVPVIDGYEFSGCSVPAKSVAGDLFDFIPLENGRLGFSLGDVSGKGMPAALLMANVQATIRAYARLTPEPNECLGKANNLLFSSTSPEKFVTLFYGILDTNSGTVTYANAGHESPLVRHGTELICLTAGGPPLGVTDGMVYGKESIELTSDDVLIVYSDGITDAVDSKGERFGIERLEEAVRTLDSLSAEEISAKILAIVERHIGDASQFDDMTLLVLKRTK
ncbi:MAG: PP2C family protein-serine/threonine phosphatase, partial [Bacteroidetes bacterium]|nr:PP2C family protein-serine/threonine phosphatase [Bacteroidota bacterium]